MIIQLTKQITLHITRILYNNIEARIRGDLVEFELGNTFKQHTSLSEDMEGCGRAAFQLISSPRR